MRLACKRVRFGVFSFGGLLGCGIAPLHARKRRIERGLIVVEAIAIVAILLHVGEVRVILFAILLGLLPRTVLRFGAPALVRPIAALIRHALVCGLSCWKLRKLLMGACLVLVGCLSPRSLNGWLAVDPVPENFGGTEICYR